MSHLRFIPIFAGLAALLACGGQSPEAPVVEEPNVEVEEATPPPPEPEKPEVTPGSLALAQFTILGENRGDEAGSSVAHVGDVNGDGFDDLLVGSWANDTVDMEAGKAYLILGRADGWDQITDLAQADATFVGVAAYDLVGFSLAGAGDVNGDGLDDFLISAQGQDTQLNNGGCVALFLGRGEADWGHDVPITQADALYWGGTESDYAGFEVSGLGDIDGDGLDDFAYNRASNLSDGTQSGILQIVFGTQDFTSPEANVGITVSQRNALFAYSFSGAGDMNGDGFADVIIGAPQMNVNGDSEVGAAYLILGRTREQWPAESLIDDIAHATYQGEGTRSLAGHAVTQVGDVNADDYADVIIGSPRNRERVDVGQWMGGSGQTFLIFGAPRPPGGEILLNSDIPSFQGVGDEDQSGDPLASAGDIDADGFSDFLIGAPRADHEQSDDGAIYLITGSVTGWAPDQVLETAAVEVWHGQNAGDKAGFAVDGNGDLNGDGRSDIVIAVPHADAKGNSTGQIHILFGGTL